MGKKLDTRSLGLDAGLEFIKWLTGAENLHYGYWDGLEVTAGNLRAAQDAYTDNLFAQLPKGRLRILDIGGGAGETAAKLLALGHQVDIVVPSAVLAERCRANAPEARVHQTTFETFETDQQFDLCLFSESFQYIRLDTGLAKACALLTEGGEILIADCFRQDHFRAENQSAAGGGHVISAFRHELARQPLTVLHESDITAFVAPSIDLEQGLFNVIGHVLSRVDDELAAKRPTQRKLLQTLLKLFLKERTRERLDARLNQKSRTSEIFLEFNHYLVLRLKRS